MIDVRPPETGNGVQYLDAPKNGVGAVTSSEDTDREGKVSARDRWTRGKAILRGEIESQKSSGSQGSGHNNIARGQHRCDDTWGLGDDQSYYEVEYYYDESDEEADIDYSRKPVP